MGRKGKGREGKGRVGEGGKGGEERRKGGEGLRHGCWRGRR